MRTLIEWLVSLFIVCLVLVLICYALDVAEKHHIEKMDKLEQQSKQDKIDAENKLIKNKLELQQEYFDQLLFKR